MAGQAHGGIQRQILLLLVSKTCLKDQSSVLMSINNGTEVSHSVDTIRINWQNMSWVQAWQWQSSHIVDNPV